VTGTTNAAITWSATAGSISSSGLFTAPTINANTTVTVTATSAADATQSAFASVTVLAPLPPSTFGNSVQGAAIGTTMSNSVSATRYQMAGQNGMVTSMSVFVASPVSASPNNQFQVAIYADNNATPGALLASSVSQTIVPDAWNTVPINAPVAANAYYWLAYNTNGLAANTNNLRYDAGGPTSAWITLESFGAWPATFGPIGGSSTYNASIYATDAPSSSGILAATPSSVNFGNVSTGASNTQTVKLTNSTAASVTISQATVKGAGFGITGLTLPATIPASNSITFNTAFAPTSAGSVIGSVSLVSDAPNSPLAIPLSGAGVSTTYQLTANPTSVNFGNVNLGNTASSSVTLTNTGNSNLTISSVTVTGAGFSASGVTAGQILTPGQSATLNVAFAPTSAGSVTGSVSVASNATNSPTAIALSGTGTSAGATVNVQNYGATGNGTADDTVAINSAIAALTSGATLFFPCGTYLITSQLSINSSNVAIDGGSCAIIHDTASGTVMVIGGSGNGNPNYGSAVALSATANELATSFTTVSSLGVAAGDYVRLQQGGEDSSTGSGNTGCDAIGCRGEILKVASVSGNTIGVTTALHDTYSPSVNAATAQKMLGPLTGITVKNITFDGNGSNVYGLAIAGVADSTVSGVTSKNVQGSALLNRGDFNVAWSNITVTGAGSAQCGSAAWFESQGNLSVNGMSIANENPGAPYSGCLYNGAFGFELIGSANSTITNLTVDGAGAYGRPMKLGASRWNTLNSITAKNGVAAMNGLAIHYYSSHNTFNNCVVTNNGAGTGTGTGNAGINSFGNFNQYNTFNNCTVTGNGNVQILVNSFDALRLAQDSHITINGGTFTGENSIEPVMVIEGASPYIHNAIINGAGATGISLDSNGINGCINNNVFTTNTRLGGAINSASSTNIGSANFLNGMSSNLIPGVCTAPLP
jgi:hypothetical protein